MAATLARLGHLAISRAVCIKCGSTLNQLPRHAGLQRANLVSRFASVPQVSGNVFSTSSPVGEETEEPDDLFRQVTVEVKCHDKAVLRSYTKFVAMAAGELGLNVTRVFQPPKVIKRYTVLKSVHIYSKHMVQYEARTHFRVFEFKHLTGSTADTFLEYIQRNLPEGMAMKVTKHRLEKIPDHLKPPPQPASNQAEASSSS